MSEIVSSIQHDDFGPEYVLEIYDVHLGMRGFLVIDNTALGPGKGGLRMTGNLTAGEIFRLARTMTWKNALVGIPFGGAKSGIVWDSSRAKDYELKKKLIQSFARAIRPLIPNKYIAGPDINTGKREMRWFAEAVKSWEAATGKPDDFCKGRKCGLPHELGSTGFGVAHAARVAAELMNLSIYGATVAIHGFGNVGTFTYRFLNDMGAVIVAIADSRGAIFRKEGLERDKMERIIRENKRINAYSAAEHISHEEFWKIPVDILIPASVTDVINDGNKNLINAKIIVEGANIPMQERIEEEFLQKGVFIVPDFVANSGGVISSYAEYKGYTSKKMFAIVERKVTQAARVVLREAIKRNTNPRLVGLEIAKEKVLYRMKKQKTSF